MGEDYLLGGLVFFCEEYIMSLGENVAIDVQYGSLLSANFSEEKLPHTLDTVSYLVLNRIGQVG